MTMENNPENLNPTPPRKSYNPFESDDDISNSLRTDSETANSKEEHIGFDLKEFEQSASPLTFLDYSLCEDGEPYDKNMPLVSKDIGVDEGAKELTHDQLDVLEAPKLKLKSESHIDSDFYQVELSQKFMVHEDMLVKKAKENSSDKEVMNPIEETHTKSNAFGLNSPTNYDPRKKEDNLQAVTFTGPVTHAGSVSIRSESSTTSTRSFAFPVLPNEWNSSPVRMEKAERRRSKNRRRWLMALVCCRSS